MGFSNWPHVTREEGRIGACPGCAVEPDRERHALDLAWAQFVYNGGLRVHETPFDRAVFLAGWNAGRAFTANAPAPPKET